MNVLLPFADEPALLCYQNKAFPVGVIQGNITDNVIEWLCTKTVNCVYNPWSPKNKFDLSVQDIWGVQEGIINQQYASIKKGIYDLLQIDLVSAMKKLLNEGYYIQGAFNEKYIPGKWAYGIEDYIHDFLLIGCDDDSFVSVGYMSDGKFKKHNIYDDDLKRSLLSEPMNKIGINLFQYNKGKELTVNINRMIEDLKKYMSTLEYIDNPEPNSITYGIASIYRLKEFFIEEVTVQNKIAIDKRYSCALYEHKWILSQLVSLFLEGKEREVYVELSCKVFNKAKQVHMLGLKMEYSKDRQIINRIDRIIEEIIACEVQYVPKLIKELELINDAR